ncbi:hypothetical protein DAPPUDRAFT_261873 [Daphnia pulex]|uniref:Uncharacterized protein n=1 Tax=Daphnia pulex TaxID=6669 RepID=E9HLU9_DAPPU|nr:hypothetical protein DAPPUDRAFT_261873 [Daphnia pulex]|eukprot:EFX67290.1 hypothetical protein DAPPUDRAFT_261873 [Daphnia pulex]
MRRSRNIGYYERSRDARGRFVARTGSHGSITSPRTRSQPGQERSPVGVATRSSQEEVEETQPETQPFRHTGCIRFRSVKKIQSSGRTSRTTTRANSLRGITRTSGGGRRSSVDFCGPPTTAGAQELDSGGNRAHNQWR